MRSVLVISKSWLERDPRVYKQILFLKEAGLRVCSVGLSPSGIEDAFYPMAINRKGLMVRSLRHTRSAVRLRLRKYDGFYWSEEWKSRILKRLSEDSQHFDLVVANDIPALPLALAISERHGAKLYLDAHEYEPLHYDSFLFNFFFRDYWHWICRKYLPRIDHMTTVSQGIADEYAENFDVRCEVMMNLPFYEGIEPVDRKDGKIRMIHHGVAARRRRMENMIELMDHLDSRFQLDLMLVETDPTYARQLKALAAGHDRIRFRPPVSMQEIPRVLNTYDVGVFLLPANSFNHRMVLPNKLFEYIQGRLALAIWPSQEMVRIVDQYQNGVYSEDFDISHIASVLNSLSQEDVLRMKWNSHTAAKELNAERTREQLLGIVDSLLS